MKKKTTTESLSRQQSQAGISPVAGSSSTEPIKVIFTLNSYLDVKLKLLHTELYSRKPKNEDYSSISQF